MPSATEAPVRQNDTATNRSKKAQRQVERKREAIVAKLASTDKLVTKRRAQLESAAQRRASLAARLARLSATDGDQPAVQAYCLKDRRQVTIGEAHAVVLANGRPAVAGTCPECGSKLVRIVAG